MVLQPKIIIKENSTDLAYAGADLFADIAKKSVSNHGRFTVAVSGGSTPRAMHCLLAGEPFLSEIPWNKTHIFWVDDRCVPYDDPASNFGAAKSDLLDKIPISSDHLHPLPVDVSPEEGAIRYQKEMLDYFRLPVGDIPFFDLIILGVGTDGHTASLFPGHEKLEEKDKLVVSLEGGNPFVHRFTMTLPALNRAGETVFLVSGSSKAGIIKKIFNNKDSRFPARLIKPINGNLTWLMDRDASLLLNTGTRQ